MRAAIGIASQGLIALLFGLGLVVAGMSNPAKVLNFLDLAAIPRGGWDPSLAFVMAGAILVASLGFWLVRKRRAPLLHDRFELPINRRIDRRVIVGPLIFGVGWGLSGFCPGPALVALGTGLAAPLGFCVAMAIGMLLARWLLQKQA